MGEDTRDAKLKEIFTKYAKQGRPDGQVGMTFEDFEAFMRVRSASFFFFFCCCLYSLSTCLAQVLYFILGS
jgi:hypothetical protein